MIRALALACALAACADAAQTVEGIVVNAVTGAPVAGAHVRVYSSDVTITATTDAGGRFHIESVPDGLYRTVYAAAGFTPSPAPGDRMAPFPVATGGDAVRLEARLQPLSKISGRVLDSDGRPVPNARLWLVQGDQSCKPPMCFSFHNQPKANDKGEYEAFNLDAGKWTLSATAPASLHAPASNGVERLAWAQTFYPNVADSKAAQPIILAPGAQLASMDIKLAAAPAHTVRGKVVDPDGNPVHRAEVELAPGYGPALEVETGADGTFEFTGIADNEYRLRATNKNLRATRFIEVRRHDVEDVELRLAGLFTLRGTVVINAPDGVPKPKAPSNALLLMSTEMVLSDDAARFTPVDNRGGVLSAPVYPGAYLIRPTGDPPVPYYLDSIRLGDREAMESVSILWDAQPLTVTYKLDGGTVRGTIENCSGARVFLIPQEEARRSWVRTTTCDSNGRFEIPAVRPGDYYGAAVGGGPYDYVGIVQDAAFLSRTARVTVRANESSSPEIRMMTR